LPARQLWRASIADNVNISSYTRILTGDARPDVAGISRIAATCFGRRARVAGYGGDILPGCSISAGAVVAAGSVVTRDVEDFAIVAGSPARFVKRRTENLTYELDFRPDWS